MGMKREYEMWYIRNCARKIQVDHQLDGRRVSRKRRTQRYTFEILNLDK